MTSSSIRGLIYSSTGSPLEILKLADISIYHRQIPWPKHAILKDDEEISKRHDYVHIKFMASPINPSDINQIEGVYPLKPTKYPAVGGNEGVAKVLNVGSAVKNLRPGDWVLPALSGFGTWRKEAICLETDLFRIADDIPLEYAATLHINPCSAFRMLQDFVTLKKNDVVIQNGANSAVGLAVIQIAAILGYKTVNIVRNRENIEDLKSNLKSLGANIVWTEEELADTNACLSEMELSLGSLPMLALNCIGGANATNMIKLLGSQGATMVTYGAMSKRPFSITAAPFIFKDITLKGFWMSAWYQKQHEEIELGKSNGPLTVKRNQMISQLANWILWGQLKFQYDLIPSERYEEAIRFATGGFSNKKYVLKFSE